MNEWGKSTKRWHTGLLQDEGRAADGLLTSINIAIVIAKGSIHDRRCLRRTGARVGRHTRCRGARALRGSQPSRLTGMGASGVSHPAILYRIYTGGRIPGIVRKVALARVKTHEWSLTIAHRRCSIFSKRILDGWEVSKGSNPVHRGIGSCHWPAIVASIIKWGWVGRYCLRMTAAPPYAEVAPSLCRTWNSHGARERRSSLR